MSPKQLREWRHTFQFTQEEAAQLLSMSLRNYQRLENNESEVSPGIAAQTYLITVQRLHPYILDGSFV